MAHYEKRCDYQITNILTATISVKSY